MRVWYLAGLALLFGACGAGTEAADSSTTIPQEVETTVPTFDTTAPPGNPGLNAPRIEVQEAIGGDVSSAVLERVLADAAERLAVAADTLEVVRTEVVDWPDGSLGCPEPGNLYTQAIVPGYRVVVSDGTHRLDYHLSETGTMKVCTGPSLGGTSPDS
jgi:hypothetical protein